MKKGISCRLLSTLMAFLMLASLVPTAAMASFIDDGAYDVGSVVTCNTDVTVSDWVTEDDVPTGAEILRTKWTYTATTETESTATSLAGFTRYGEYWRQTAANSFRYTTSDYYSANSGQANFSGLHTSPATPSETDTTKRLVSNTFSHFVYYHWTYVGGYCVFHTYGQCGDCSHFNDVYRSFTSTTEYNDQKDCNGILGNEVFYIPRSASGVYDSSWWWYKVLVYTSTYTDHEKVFKYRKVENLESTTEVTPSSTISNVQKWVKYRISLDVYNAEFGQYIGNNGIIYTVDSEDKTATVCGYRNPGDDVYSVYLDIPSHVYVDETFTVNTIGPNAFEECGVIVSVNIPSTVTSIGNEAFIYCTGLENIIIPSSVVSIGECAFSFCTSIRKAVIGNGVTTIGVNAFQRCMALDKVSLGVSVEEIGSQAFSYCNALRSVYFIGEKPEVAVDAFKRSNNSGKTISIYYNTSKSTWYGIGGWKNDVGFVTKLYLTQTLNLTDESQWSQYINWYVYNQGDIIYLDENGFDFQGNKYTCENTTASLTLFDVTESITGGDICIPSRVFFNTAEYTVNEIGQGIFANQSTLTRVSIGDNISIIGTSAFENCRNIKTVNFGSGVTTIRDSAFSGCTSIEGLYFEGAVPSSVGRKSFDDVSRDAYVVHYNYQGSWSTSWQRFKVYICDPLTQVSNTNYFRDETGVYYSILSPENKMAIVGKAVSTSAEDEANAINTGFEGTGDISIADFVDINGDMYMVSGLDRFAFFKSNITSISFGRFIGFNMTDEQPGIWDCTFRQANNLTAINVNAENEVYYSSNGILYKYDTVLNNAVTMLMQYPAGKTGTSFTVPNGVTTVNQYAFAEQRALQSVNLNGTVTVGDHAFYNCTNLTAVTAASVRTVDAQAFRNCSALSSISLSQIDTIGDEAFYGCASLSTVNLNGITDIGAKAFVYCNNVRSFTVTGSTKYSTDSAGALFETNEGTKKLLQYPAGSNATSYTISDATVVSIEPYAFYCADDLNTLTLSDSINTIGEHAFEKCSKIKTIHLGSTVSSIGTRAFYDCEALAGFTVASTNVYYYADGMGVLYRFARDMEGQLITRQDGSLITDTLICYPSGIEKINYTVPAEVEEISSAAFAKNTNLKRVVLPATIGRVRDEVFSGCTQLFEVYFKGEIPAEFGDGVFDGTSSELTVYYLPENTTWAAGTLPRSLRSCTLLAYNAIEELSNNISFVNSYAIVIANSEGQNITSATVTVDGIAATYSKGMYVFGMPENYNTSSGVRVAISNPGYYAYNNTLFLDEELHLSYITIKKQSTVQGISCNGSDINTKTLSINKWLYSDSAGGLRRGSDITFTVHGYCDSSYIISKYAIVQNGSVIAVATPGPSSSGGLTKDYTFTIPAVNLAAEAKLQVYMEVWDNAANSVVDTLYSNLNVSIYSQVIAIKRTGGGGGGGGDDGPSAPQEMSKGGFKISLGSGVNLKLNTGLEWFDSMQLKIKWKDYGMSVKYTSDDEVEIELSSAKEETKSISLSLSGSIKLVKAGKGWRIASCSVVAGCKLQLPGTETDAMIGPVPVTVGAKLSVSGEIWLTLTFKPTQNIMSLVNLDYVLGGEIKLRAGFGCKAASVGVTGAIKSKMTLGVYPKVCLKKWYLEGKVGLYAQAGIGNWKVELEVWLKKIKKTVYNNGVWLPADSELFDDSYDEYQKALLNMYLADNYALTESTGASSLESHVKLVKLSPTKAVKIYLVDVNHDECNSQATYDSLNYVKIAYCTGRFNPITQNWSWSSPKLVDDNGRNDSEYNLYYDKDSGKAYVIYSQESSAIDSNETIDAYASKSEIKAAVWNGSEFELMDTAESNGAITNDGMFDGGAIMTEISGMPVAVWSKNTDNNFLGLSDYNYVDDETGDFFANDTSANELWYSYYDDGMWSKAERVVDNLPLITSISAAKDGTVLLTVDPDSNPATKDADGNVIEDDKAYEVLLGEFYDYASLTPIANLDGTSNVITLDNDYLMVYKESGMFRVSDGSEYLHLGNPNIKNYKLVEDGDGNIEAFIYTETVSLADSARGDALFGIFYDGTSFGSPVQLTQAAAEVYYDSFDAELINDKLVIEGLTTSVVISETETDMDMEKTSTITGSIYEYKNDVIVNSASLADEKVEAGTAINAKVNITNNSGNSLTDAKVTLYAPDGSVAASENTQRVNVASGETADVNVSFTVSDLEDGEYTIKVAADNESDETDNTAKLRLAFSDLAVYGRQIVLNEGNYVIASVKNSGSVNASGTLYVMKEVFNESSPLSASETCLYKMSFTDLEPGVSAFYKIIVDGEFYDNGEETGVLTLYVESTQPETESEKSNNYEYISTVDVLKTDEMIALGAQGSPAFAEDYFACELVQGTSDISATYTGNGYELTGLADVPLASYGISNGTLTISNSYIKGLGEGTHTVDAVFSNGTNTVIRTITIINYIGFARPTWVVNGVTTVDDYIVAETTPVFTGSTDKPADSQYTYQFVGWDMDSDGEADVFAGEDIPTILSDTTYVAVYDSTPLTYTVSWDTAGRITEKEYEAGATPRYCGPTEKVGDAGHYYTMSGWDANEDGIVDYSASSILPVVSGEARYVAVYREALPITASLFTVDTGAEKYTGEEITKEIESTLELNRDYIVAYSGNISAGTATITITGIGEYGGQLAYRFDIRNGVYVGGTRYATLNEAIQAVPATNAKTRVTMYSDIVSATKVYINEGQNVVLDMNGCTYTASTASGYAITVQSDGNAEIMNGTLNAATAGGINILDGGGLGKLDGVTINSGKYAVNNGGTIGEIVDSTLTGTIAFYNTGTVSKITSGMFNGTSYGVYNAGSINSVVGGVYAANEAGNAFFTADIGSVTFADADGSYEVMHNNRNRALIVPASSETEKKTVSAKTNLSEVFADSAQYTYTGIPSCITNYETNEGYYGTGSVISEYDAVHGALVRRFKLVVEGDVNGDSVCDALDVALAELEISQHYTNVGAFGKAADVDDNGNFDISDFSAILNRSVGISF